MSGDYTTVTELPGSGATREQLSMLYTRYRIASDLAEGKEVLEVACGTGIGLGYLAKRARKVVGGDYDPRMIEMAREHYDHRLEILPLDAQNLPFNDETFDVILMLEAIYYLPEPERFVSEARRVLRDGGTIFICSANREWLSFNPSPFSFTYFSASELKQLLSRAGFLVEIFAGFPATEPGLKSRVLGAVRKVAVRLHLIPRTMRGKGIIKRLFFGRLSPLPAELTEDTGEFHPLVPVDGDRAVTGYKVIYAIGRLMPQ